MSILAMGKPTGKGRYKTLRRKIQYKLCCLMCKDTQLFLIICLFINILIFYM